MRRLGQFVLAVLFLPILSVGAEPHALGTVLDPVRYSLAPQKARLTTRAYEALPTSFSLKAYAPKPQSQGNFGTCAAWATAFAARTITESVALGRTNRDETNRNVFSPTFVYKNIASDPNECQAGSSLEDALDLMVKRGVPKLQPIETQQPMPLIPLDLYEKLPKFAIGSWAALFGPWVDGQSTLADRVLPVKKSLSSNKAVVIGMEIYPSFDAAVQVWNPVAGEASRGGHGMCVVGYDDTRYGGAFEIQNSWGSEWGTGGFVWIRYADFARYVNEAYEMGDNLVAAATLSFQASVKVRLAGEAAPMGFVQSSDGQSYRSQQVYPSGTRFRLYLTNGEPAYVYALATDGLTPTQVLLPQNSEKTSALLDYPGSEVSYPGENQWIKMDNTEGVDTVAVLYSKQALDIQAINRVVEAGQGDFLTRLASAVGPSFVKPSRGKYEANEPTFQATSTSKDAVFCLILNVRHGL